MSDKTLSFDALSGMDNQLFVSTYLLQLPDKDQLREFLIKQMEEMKLKPNLNPRKSLGIAFETKGF